MAIDGNHSKKAMTGARFVPAKLPPGRCAGLQEEGWAASPHTDFSAADLCAGANTEFGRGAPGPAPTALSPQHPEPLDGFPPPPLPLPPTPQPRGAGGGGGRLSPCPFKSLPSEAPQEDPGRGGSSTLSFRRGAWSQVPGLRLPLVGPGTSDSPTLSLPPRGSPLPWPCAPGSAPGAQSQPGGSRRPPSPPACCARCGFPRSAWPAGWRPPVAASCPPSGDP